MGTRFVCALKLLAGPACVFAGGPKGVAAPVPSPCPIGQSQLVEALKASVKPSGARAMEVSKRMNGQRLSPAMERYAPSPSVVLRWTRNGPLAVLSRPKKPIRQMG